MAFASFSGRAGSRSLPWIVPAVYDVFLTPAMNGGGLLSILGQVPYILLFLGCGLLFKAAHCLTSKSYPGPTLNPATAKTGGKNGAYYAKMTNSHTPSDGSIPQGGQSGEKTDSGRLHPDYRRSGRNCGTSAPPLWSCSLPAARNG